MSRSIVRFGALALAVLVSGAGCSSEPGTENKGSEPAAVAGQGAGGDSRPVKIPIIEGYTYYVGGPVLGKDRYGRLRISKFLGEVAQPPARGMVIGAKRDGDRLEYRVWVNGRGVGVYRGVMREGMFWREYIETFHGDKTVAREFTVNDDAAEVMRVKLEDVDPATGETIRVTERTTPYAVPELIDLPDDEDEDSEAAQGGSDETAPSKAAPSPPAAVPGSKAAPAPTEGE